MRIQNNVAIQVLYEYVSLNFSRMNRDLFRAMEFGTLELDAKQSVLSTRLALFRVESGSQESSFESHIVLGAQTVPQEHALQMLMQRMSGGQLQLLSRLAYLENSIHEANTVTKTNGRFCHYITEYLNYTSNYKKVMRNQQNREVGLAWQQRYDPTCGCYRYGNYGTIVNQWLSIRYAEAISTSVSGKQEYSFQFSRAGNDAPLVGIAVIDPRTECGAINLPFHTKPKSWLYNGNSGTLFKMSKSLQYCQTQVSSNGVLRMRVDLPMRDLAFYSNDINCGNIHLEINDDDLTKIYIVVDIFSLGDFVEIL